MPKTTVTKTTSKSGEREIVQYRLTVPKALAEGHGLDNAELDWTVESANRFVLTRVDDD